MYVFARNGTCLKIENHPLRDGFSLNNEYEVIAKRIVMMIELLNYSA